MKRTLALLLCCALISLSSAAGAIAATTIAYGQSGRAVQVLQEQLTQLGYSTGGTDGKFGYATKAAVMKFQRDHSMKADGLAGLTTQNLLASLTGTEPAINASGTVTVSSSASSGSAASTSYGLFNGDYTTISYGHSGTRVKTLQQALKTAGFFTGNVDGKFGNTTLAAVKSFQTSRKLIADGLAGKKTLQALESAQSSSTSSSSTALNATVTSYVMPTRTLRSGYSGSDVTSVQSRLKELGYYTGTVGTTYNKATISAVKAFQTANGLQADGLAGTKTCAVMYSASAVSASAAAASSSASSTSSTSSASTATPSTAVTLRSGSSGEQVTLMQQALQKLGYAVTVNGSYDQATKSAVKAFQLNNSLSSDGVAGPKTLACLYGGKALSASEASSSASSSSSSSTASGTAVSALVGKGNNGASIRLMHWYNEVKPSLSSGSILSVYVPVSGKTWKLKVLSRGHHADSEPVSAEDTANMLAAFGGKNTWSQKAVYVKLPSGSWTLASTHDMPHLSGSNTSNNFDGHLCVHFFRDMDECKANDPSYGVSNQNTIRAAWKALTGETIN